MNGWLVFIDDFNSYTWEKVADGMDGPALAEARNKKLDAMGLEEYGRWYWTPTGQRPITSQPSAIEPMMDRGLIYFDVTNHEYATDDRRVYLEEEGPVFEG